MKRIYSSQSLAMVEQFRDALEENGISTIVRNHKALVPSGGHANSGTRPELWIMNDSDLLLAQSVIAQGSKGSVGSAEAWKCRCGEENEGTLISCWNCGRDRQE